MEVVVASQNVGKIKEFKAILEPLGYHVLGLEDVGVSMDDVMETGETFEENALLKARYVYEQSGRASIADDSGLVLEAHPEILGVYSARYLGEDTSYAIKNQSLLSLYEGESNRRCKFVSAIAFVTPTEATVFVGDIEGELASTLQGSGGFGYDPLFIPTGYTDSFGTMEPALKNSISHRARALHRFVQHIEGKHLNEE